LDARFLSGAALAEHLAEQFGRIDTQSLGNGDELGYIDLPLIAFDHADNRMRSLETRRKLSL
jgi:hypothetical protein